MSEFSDDMPDFEAIDWDGPRSPAFNPDFEHQASASRGEIAPSGGQRKVTNAFALRQMAEAQAGDNNPEISANDRKDKESGPLHRPKAVFRDLQSAHQSITSRNNTPMGNNSPKHEQARFSREMSSSSTTSSVQQDAHIDPSAFRAAVQKFEAPRSHSPTNSLASTQHDDAGLGAPVKRVPVEQFEIEDKAMLARRPSAISTVSSYMRTAIGDAFTSAKRSSVKYGDESSEYRSNNRPVSTVSIVSSASDGENRLPHEPISLPVQMFSSSPAVTNTWPQAPGHLVASGSSGIDNSTVNEIYRAYEGASSPQYAVSKEEVSEYSFESLEPNDQLPRLAREQELRDSEEDIYGDSGILSETDPGTSDPVVPQSGGAESGRSDNALSVAVSSVPSLTEVNWRHRYSAYPDTRLAREESFKSTYSEQSRVPVVPRVHNPEPSRLPLERDISRELRRASGLSEASFDENEGFQAQNQPLANGGGRIIAHVPIFEESDSDDQRSSHSQSTTHTERPVYQEEPPPAFYNQAAISPHWVGYDQEVRVPIQQANVPTRSPRRPPAPSTPIMEPAPALLGHRVHEEDEWQTIGGSVWGTESMDTSEQSSTTRISGDYGSTDRIAQHPAPVAGHSNFVRRQVAGGHQPVLLPVHDQYRVNGLPSNSMRLPAAPLHGYRIPTPLGQGHNNPFSSSPPDLSPTRSQRLLRARGRNIFPPTNSTLTTDDSGTTNRRSDSRRAKHASDASKRLSETDEWLRNTAISAIPPAFRSAPTTPIRARPSSFGLVQAVANGEEIPGYIVENGRITRDPTQMDGHYEPEERPSVIQAPRRIRPHEPAVGEFRYRSPLAPPRDTLMRHLYTENHLDGINRVNYPLTEDEEATLGVISQQRLDEAPILRTFASTGDFEPQEKTWNRVTFFLLAFFPPLLFCFALGLFDGLLYRWTDGRLLQFRLNYKSWAGVVFGVETFVIILVAVVGSNSFWW